MQNFDGTGGRRIANPAAELPCKLRPRTPTPNSDPTLDGAPPKTVGSTPQPAVRHDDSRAEDADLAPAGAHLDATRPPDAVALFDRHDRTFRHDAARGEIAAERTGCAPGRRIFGDADGGVEEARMRRRD